MDKCRYCTKRYPACQDTCKYAIAEKLKNEKIKQARWNEIEINKWYYSKSR